MRLVTILIFIFSIFGSTSLETINKEIIKKSVQHGSIPKLLLPYLNMSAIEQGKKEHNGSLEFVIRDEDVADIPDDEPDLRVNEIFDDGNKTIIRISDDATLLLYQKWVDQAASGLMAAMVTKKINDGKLSKLDLTHHGSCTDSARNLNSHAKCVVNVLNKIRERERRLLRFKKLRRRRRVRRSILDIDDNDIKIRVKQKNEYQLKEKQEIVSPFSLIAKHLVKMLREKKGKSGKPKKWMKVIREIRDEANRVREKKKTNSEFRRKFAKYSNVMKDIQIDPSAAFQKMGMENFFKESPEDEQDSKSPSEQEIATRKSMLMIREGVKLGMMMAGKNVSNFDERKVSIFSPQFMSVFPDEQANDTISLLSPSVLALHEQGNELDNSISLSRAMRFLSDTGQESWMNFVLEASGVTEAVDEMREKERKEELDEWRRQFTNDRGQPMYFTRNNVSDMYGDYEATKIDAMQQLHRSMSAEQLREMNSTGFSVMSKEQIARFYGPGSPYNDSYAFNTFSNVSKDTVSDLVELNVRKLATEEIAFKVSRKKDITLTPVLFSSLVLVPGTVSQPIVLSPIVFSPLILSPSALGPLILSPWIFTPLILSPRVLGPIILSPTIFSPLILTPMCLGPLILSPAVAVPLILSPFVLNPFILTPVVMVPFILNPFCLSPLIGVPNTLSPLVLSPFVLSPFILSPPYVNAFLLSPYALSPIVLSDGFLFTAVLSPSWLSSI